eukprot:snap_masked-scaffold_26-processed-gene-2.19-mRNA-1 protein AED:1.00 eAED:1.00 QI:0/-1/0/0/-1/1/1/0/61
MEPPCHDALMVSSMTFILPMDIPDVSVQSFIRCILEETHRSQVGIAKDVDCMNLPRKVSGG